MYNVFKLVSFGYSVLELCILNTMEDHFQKMDLHCQLCVEMEEEGSGLHFQDYRCCDDKGLGEYNLNDNMAYIIKIS